MSPYVPFPAPRLVGAEVERLKRVCIVQPILTNYRLPVFRELAEHCHVDVVHSIGKGDSGFGEPEAVESPNLRFICVPTLRPFDDKLGMYQWGLARYIRRERPDAIIHWVNPRYLSFWTTLMWGRLLGIPVYGHGHGVYKKQRISWAYRQMMRLLLKLVASYICYAPFVRESFVRQGFDGRKLSVADNSAINTCPVRPEEKTGTERGVLFIGRLRAGCNVSLLIRAIERIRNTDGVPVTLQVIGTGDEQEALRTEAAARPWVTLHGELYDAGRIREISRDCAVGCYPGNAGLSVVHLMSLSLPVITHDDLPGHSGPEPSFVRNGVSGVLYDHRRPEEALYNALRGLIGDPAALHRMRSAAFLDYEELVHPTLASRLWAILGR